MYRQTENGNCSPRLDKCMRVLSESRNPRVRVFTHFRGRNERKCRLYTGVSTKYRSCVLSGSAPSTTRFTFRLSLSRSPPFLSSLHCFSLSLSRLPSPSCHPLSLCVSRPLRVRKSQRRVQSCLCYDVHVVSARKKSHLLMTRNYPALQWQTRVKSVGGGSGGGEQARSRLSGPRRGRNCGISEECGEDPTVSSVDDPERHRRVRRAELTDAKVDVRE